MLVVAGRGLLIVTVAPVAVVAIVWFSGSRMTTAMFMVLLPAEMAVNCRLKSVPAPLSGGPAVTAWSTTTLSAVGPGEGRDAKKPPAKKAPGAAATEYCISLWLKSRRTWDACRFVIPATLTLTV